MIEDGHFLTALLRVSSGIGKSGGTYTVGRGMEGSPLRGITKMDLEPLLATSRLQLN